MLSSYSRYFCLKLSDTWPLLDIKERHTRTKEGKKQKKLWSCYTLQLQKDSFHSVKKQYFSTPALL